MMARAIWKIHVGIVPVFPGNNRFAPWSSPQWLCTDAGTNVSANEKSRFESGFSKNTNRQLLHCLGIGLGMVILRLGVGLGLFRRGIRVLLASALIGAAQLLAGFLGSLLIALGL